jgi:2-polyprenyl-3-methyl-5-hydroxy-6-metoxy-1,4-benzoquinol methylase
MPLTVQEQFGQIDIYVFDQILRGNIAAGMRVLDAGCGYGRNLVHLLREGCQVLALDADATRPSTMCVKLSARYSLRDCRGELSGRAHREDAFSG